MPKIKWHLVPQPPTKGTLRKYGMTAADWLRIAQRQYYICPVCREPFGVRKLVIDHAHAHGFRKMKPIDKQRHVRGILHSFCNRYVRGWLTLKRATAIVDYLQAHEARKAK